MPFKLTVKQPANLEKDRAPPSGALDRLDTYKQGSNLRLLIVDDDPLFSELVVAALRDDGHAVWLAKSGSEALEQMDHAQPHVILLDCGLRDISELTLIEEFKRYRTNVVVVILSARRGSIHEQIMRSFGADLIYNKSINFSDIRCLCNKIIDNGLLDER